MSKSVSQSDRAKPNALAWVPVEAQYIMYRWMVEAGTWDGGNYIPDPDPDPQAGHHTFGRRSPEWRFRTPIRQADE